jgi:YVTN family beta-propeller protein
LVSAEKPKPVPIGVFANLNTNCIQYIDPATNIASAPLLKGYLGSYAGQLLDVVITSDGKTAVVSNFGDSTIFFIDISKGFAKAPKLLGSTYIGIFAEDMVITPDDKYVLVTDGGFAAQIAVVEICSGILKCIKNLGYMKDFGAYRQAQAAAITPDGQLVVVADYSNRFIHSYMLDSNGQLTFKESHKVAPARPVNLAISPDGKTLIVVCSYRSSTPIFTICPGHNLTFKEFIALPARGGQSCIFNSKGDKAYYLTNGNPGRGTQVHILNVPEPGKVSASGTSITLYPPRGTSQFFGVETIALDPDENFLYVTNPSPSGALNGISVINLKTNTEVFSIKGTGYPTGICFATQKAKIL